MHLQQHPGAETLRLQPLVDPDHGDLDQIGRRTLDWGVGCSTLTERPDIEVAVTQLRDIATPLEDGLDVSVLSSIVDHRVQIRTYPLEAFEVAFDELLRFRVRDLQLPREGVRTLSVDRGEVDRLGAATHLRGHLL